MTFLLGFNLNSKVLSGILCSMFCFFSSAIVHSYCFWGCVFLIIAFRILEYLGCVCTSVFGGFHWGHSNPSKSERQVKIQPFSQHGCTAPGSWMYSTWIMDVQHLSLGSTDISTCQLPDFSSTVSFGGLIFVIQTQLEDHQGGNYIYDFMQQ